MANDRLYLFWTVIKFFSPSRSFDPRKLSSFSFIKVQIKLRIAKKRESAFPFVQLLLWRKLICPPIQSINKLGNKFDIYCTYRLTDGRHTRNIIRKLNFGKRKERFLFLLLSFPRSFEGRNERKKRCQTSRAPSPSRERLTTDASCDRYSDASSKLN